MIENNVLGVEDIKQIIPHRYPFLMVDRIENLNVGTSCTAYKNVSINEWFFQGHFPQYPVFPGVLIIEAMAQSAGVLAFKTLINERVTEPGKSDFTQNDPKVRETLANKGESSIKYDNNGEPDFHPISEATVEIENMTADRYSYFDENGIRHEGNFEKADKKLAEQWNAECKDNRSDWTTKDVKDWVKDNNLTRHECLDKKTVEYVDSGTHGECKHYGGVAECKARDNSNVGGNFDV